MNDYRFLHKTENLKPGARVKVLLYMREVAGVVVQQKTNRYGVRWATVNLGRETVELQDHRVMVLS